METYTVKVSIDGRSIKVDKSEIKMMGGDCIQWEGNEGFSIVFDDPTPFGAKLDYAQARSQNRPRDVEKKTKYKYTVIADRDSSIQLDPVVIVDPGSKGDGH